MVTQNFPHKKMRKKYFLNFYTKITFWGSLGNKLMGKKTNLGQKMFLVGNGAPSKKNFGHLRVSPEFLNYKSLESHIRPRHIVWELE